MIYINGKVCEWNMNQFNNLEEIIVASFNSVANDNQIITNVILNDEPFSEIYPHQAEDVSVSNIEKLEFFSVDLNHMAESVVEELFKVTKSMSLACTTASTYFRRGDEAEALDMLQDLIEVQRSFLNMVGTLRTDFNIPESDEVNELTNRFSELLSEVINVMDYEDWVLLADFLEFEVAPICNEWNVCLEQFQLFLKFSKETIQ